LSEHTTQGGGSRVCPARLPHPGASARAWLEKGFDTASQQPASRGAQGPPAAPPSPARISVISERIERRLCPRTALVLLQTVISERRFSCRAVSYLGTSPSVWLSPLTRSLTQRTGALGASLLHIQFCESLQTPIGTSIAVSNPCPNSPRTVWVVRYSAVPHDDERPDG